MEKFNNSSKENIETKIDYILQNKDILANMYSNASQEEILQDTHKMLNEMKNYKNGGSSKKVEEMFANSLKEMTNADEVRKNLKLEYDKSPKQTRFQIMKNHRICVANMRNNPVYDVFNNNNSDNKLCVVTRTSNINVKLDKSSCNIENMKKILIKDLSIDKTNTNKYCILKLIDLPGKMNSIELLVEDGDSNVTTISIYNYDKIKKFNNFEELDKEFPVGKYVLVYEPYYKISNSKTLIIRVDNPDEIVVFNLLEDFNKFLISSTSNTFSSLELKNKGNDHMKKAEFERARLCYEKAAEIDNSNPIIFSNLAECYLKLKLNLNGLEAAEKSLNNLKENDNIYDKVLMRKAKALYNLNRFSQCLNILSKLKKDNDEKINAAEYLINKCEIKMKNQNGVYDYKKMLEEESTIFYLDYGEYVNPKVKLNYTKEKGVHLISLENLEKGELISASKSVACISQLKEDSKQMFMKEDKNVLTILSDAEENRKQLINLLIGREKEMEEFFYLFDGTNEKLSLDERKSAFEKMNEKNNVDGLSISKIDNILKCNGFSTTRGLKKQLTIANGLWIFSSFLNHSCVANSFYFGIGDFLFIKASKNIIKNEEISISYTSGMKRYEARSKLIKQNWKFDCKCPLCIYQISKTINNETKTYIIGLIDYIISKHPNKADENTKKDRIIGNSEEYVDYFKFENTIQINYENEYNKFQKNFNFIYDYLKEHKKLFSKIEMANLLLKYSRIIYKYDLILFETALKEAFNFIKNSEILVELEILLILINHFHKTGDQTNFNLYRSIYISYSCLFDYDLELQNLILIGDGINK